jgi:hypothetical protein
LIFSGITALSVVEEELSVFVLSIIRTLKINRTIAIRQKAAKTIRIFLIITDLGAHV